MNQYWLFILVVFYSLLVVINLGFVGVILTINGFRFIIGSSANLGSALSFLGRNLLLRLGNRLGNLCSYLKCFVILFSFFLVLLRFKIQMAFFQSVTHILKHLNTKYPAFHHVLIYQSFPELDNQQFHNMSSSVFLLLQNSTIQNLQIT